MNKIWRLAVPIVAATLLIGCVPNGSTAFTVDGTRVSERQINAATSGCATVTKDNPGELRTSMLNSVLAGGAGEKIAAATSTAVTQQERDEYLSSTTQGQAMLTDPECAKVANGLATYLIVLDRIGDTDFAAALKQLQVQVNPRYGTWDPEQGGAVGSGSLSQPAATPTKAP